MTEIAASSRLGVTPRNDRTRPLQNQDSETKSRRARIEAAGILLYFEDFEPRPDNELGRKLKFCRGLRTWLSL
jgi:hypothetical protein